MFASISRAQGTVGFYYHGKESQASINDMVFSSPLEGLSDSNEGLFSVCW